MDRITAKSAKSSGSEIVPSAMLRVLLPVASTAGLAGRNFCRPRQLCRSQLATATLRSKIEYQPKRLFGRQTEFVGQDEILHDVESPGTALYCRKTLLGPAKGLREVNLGQTTILSDLAQAVDQLPVFLGIDGLLAHRGPAPLWTDTLGAGHEYMKNVYFGFTICLEMRLNGSLAYAPAIGPSEC